MRETHDKVPVLLFSCVLDEILENHQTTAALAVKKLYVRNQIDDFFSELAFFSEIVFVDQFGQHNLWWTTSWSSLLWIACVKHAGHYWNARYSSKGWEMQRCVAMLLQGVGSSWKLKWAFTHFKAYLHNPSTFSLLKQNNYCPSQTLVPPWQSVSK